MFSLWRLKKELKVKERKKESLNRAIINLSSGRETRARLDTTPGRVNLQKQTYLIKRERGGGGGGKVNWNHLNSNAREPLIFDIESSLIVEFRLDFFFFASLVFLGFSSGPKWEKFNNFSLFQKKSKISLLKEKSFPSRSCLTVTNLARKEKGTRVNC